jgi:hypothetical protein
MPRKIKLDAAALWRDIEEHLTPAFSLWPSDRVLYFYLVRMSRLAGERIILMPARTVSRATLLSRSTVRTCLRRLAAKGIMRILGRSYAGLRLDVKLPREMPGCIRDRLPDGRTLESLDFWTSKNRRPAIFRRDGHRCFYCLRRLLRHKRVLDHVIPRARIGQHSYRNLVACCSDCNMAKKDRPASALLRRLYRDGKLTSAEFRRRLAALKTLAAGRLRPVLPSRPG